MSNSAVRYVAGSCLVVALQVGAPAPSVPLPGVALQAADAGVVPAAYFLARANVLAGIVTTQNPSDFAFVRGLKTVTGGSPVPLSDVVDRLRKTHPQVDVAWRDGLLGVVERGSVCADAVRKTPVGPMEFDGDAARAVVFLTWLATGSQGQPRGMTGSILGSTADLAQTMPAMNYVLSSPMSMQDALDRVVRAAKGGVWFAWQHTRKDGRVGCRAVAYWPNGQVSAPEEDFFVAVSK